LEEIMRKPAAAFPIALALGAISLAPVAGAQVQDTRAEGPIEIEQCQTISHPGSYKLVNNLIATGDCLVITVSFVTVDLAGFTISGGGPPPFGSGSGIIAVPPPHSASFLAGLAIRNGSISTLSFNAGVDLGSAAGSIVEGLRVSGVTLANTIAISANGIVKGNIVEGFRGTGVIATGTVTGNYVAGTRIGMEVGEGSTVIGNTILNSIPEGLVVSCPSNVIDNTVTSHGGMNLVLIGDGCHSEGNVAP
jgi:hypothetical protein